VYCEIVYCEIVYCEIVYCEIVYCEIVDCERLNWVLARRVTGSLALSKGKPPQLDLRGILRYHLGSQ
jgi:hypothetical protein